jgi:hypothetical protein
VAGGEPLQEYDVDPTASELPGCCGSHCASANDRHVDRLHGTFLSHVTGLTGDEGKIRNVDMSSDTSPVGVGDTAPDFTLRSQSGEPVSLSDFRPDQVVVLYFYPRTTPPAARPRHVPSGTATKSSSTQALRSLGSAPTR